MKINTFTQGLKISALACSLLFLAHPVSAQETTANSIEEVIVTSQRVEESL